MCLIEEHLETPVVDSCDVLVAGGGIAGISAALSAARCGAKVILAEREYMLGGLATLGLITIYLPLCDGMGNQMIYGIGEELLLLSIKHGAERLYPEPWLENGDLEMRKKIRYQAQYNLNLFAIEVEQLLLKEGVKILYGSMVCNIKKNKDIIKAVIIESKSGRQAISVKSVVDATGDADVCKLSGATTRLFNPKNPLAAWYYSSSVNGVSLKMQGASDIPDENTKQIIPALVNRRFTALEAEELSEMVFLSHEKILQDVLKQRETDSSYNPVTIPLIPQVRMTRRIAGMLELDDTDPHKFVENSIGVTGDWRKRGPAFEIPFESLYGKDIKNLITAGRCISVTDAMWDITRVIPCCAVTGEAAGAAAAMSESFATLDVKKLQNRLMEFNVKLHIYN